LEQQYNKNWTEVISVIIEIKGDATKRMRKSVDSLQNNLTKIRTGRANTSLLDQISLDYYGSEVPLNQVANIGIEDSRTLKITPWEKDMIQPIEKAIMNSDLGLNPTSAGMIIRVPLPPLTEERRKDMTRVVKQEGEQSRIAIRNIRRDSLNDVKDLLKEKMIGEDEERKAQEEIQVLTDQYVKEVDQAVAAKEKELMVI
jgi:ribosome recycling factor